MDLEITSTSGIKRGDRVLKTLYTPDIVRTDEPNEILIEIDTGKLYFFIKNILQLKIQPLTDGKIRTTINEVTTLTYRVADSDKLKFISFTTPSEGNLVEFFYDCNLN